MFQYNDCVPYRAAGHFTPYRVKLRLWRIRSCDGRLQYLSLRWTYVGSKPSGPRSQKVYFGWKRD